MPTALLTLELFINVDLDRWLEKEIVSFHNLLHGFIVDVVYEKWIVYHSIS